MNRTIGMVALLAAALLPACKDNGTGNVACPDLPRPVVIIQVTDASTGNPAAEEATGTITEGSFTAELHPYGADRLAPRVYDRPGTYSVLVRKAGFRDWTRNNVQVQADECGAQPAQLEAFLVPG